MQMFNLYQSEKLRSRFMSFNLYFPVESVTIFGFYFARDFPNVLQVNLKLKSSIRRAGLRFS